jgi:hypothetical protein
VLQFGQFTASLLFVVLYVWSTYSTPAPFSVRYNMDLALCALFATEFLWRLFVSTLPIILSFPVFCMKE